MQHNKSFRLVRTRKHSRRVGLDPAMAKAIARSEFGRFYVDDQQQREVQRSLDRAKGRRQPAEEQKPAAAPAKPESKPKSKPELWHQPSVRERRTEIADAKARIAAEAKLREAREGSER